MTNEKTEKVVYKTPAGEIFDVIGAFERHPAITPRQSKHRPVGDSGTRQRHPF